MLLDCERYKVIYKMLTFYLKKVKNIYTVTLTLRTFRAWYSYNRTESVKHKIVSNQGCVKYFISRQFNIHHPEFIIITNDDI